jgi:hypothetical protein
MLTSSEDVIDLGGWLTAPRLDAERVTQEEPHAEATPWWERVELAIRTTCSVVRLLASLSVGGAACAPGYGRRRTARLGARRAWAGRH